MIASGKSNSNKMIDGNQNDLGLHLQAHNSIDYFKFFVRLERSERFAYAPRLATATTTTRRTGRLGRVSYWFTQLIDINVVFKLRPIGGPLLHDLEQRLLLFVDEFVQRQCCPLIEILFRFAQEAQAYGRIDLIDGQTASTIAVVRYVVHFGIERWTNCIVVDR